MRYLRAMAERGSSPHPTADGDERGEKQTGMTRRAVLRDGSAAALAVLAAGPVSALGNVAVPSRPLRVPRLPASDELATLRALVDRVVPGRGGPHRRCGRGGCAEAIDALLGAFTSTRRGSTPARRSPTGAGGRNDFEEFLASTATSGRPGAGGSRARGRPAGANGPVDGYQASTASGLAALSPGGFSALPGPAREICSAARPTLRSARCSTSSSRTPSVHVRRPRVRRQRRPGRLATPPSRATPSRAASPVTRSSTPRSTPQRLPLPAGPAVSPAGTEDLLALGAASGSRRLVHGSSPPRRRGQLAAIASGAPRWPSGRGRFGGRGRGRHRLRRRRQRRRLGAGPARLVCDRAGARPQHAARARRGPQRRPRHPLRQRRDQGRRASSASPTRCSSPTRRRTARGRPGRRPVRPGRARSARRRGRRDVAALQRQDPRFWRQDFTRLSDLGPVEGAQVADWPIGYDDLAPFYDDVERQVGVQGDRPRCPRARSSSPRGAGSFVMPPNPTGHAAAPARRGRRRLGYDAYPYPAAVNSAPINGRPACTPAACARVRLPDQRPRRRAGVVAQPGPRTGRVQIVPRAYVHRIETSRSGRPRHCRALPDVRGRAHRLAATMVGRRQPDQHRPAAADVAQRAHPMAWVTAPTRSAGT